MKKILKRKKFLSILFCILLLLSTVSYAEVTYEKTDVSANSSNNANQKKLSFDNVDNTDQVLYLSDIPYSKGQVAWGSISLDKTQDNTAFTMLLNGSTTVIKKGIWAHATSTLEYDISSYKDYAYFTTYYGINTTSGNKGNGVKFYIYTSEDGVTWTLRTEENPTAIKSSNNAVAVKIDIRNANYIKLYANDNGSNASDHVVWGDAKLVKEDYNENVMTTVEEYDEIIRASYERGAVKEELKLTLLQRDFIKRVGQYQLRNFLEEDPKNKETLEWFLNNEEALRLWTVGGTPNGTYLRALQVLSELYHTHGEDLTNEELTANGVKYKDLYLKMMLSLSLTHSTNVGLWIGGSSKLSDAVTRYEIYKQMHLDNKLASNSMFENYTIEEMRGVMITNIDDEEILWLRDYSEKKFSNIVDRFNPFKYINYTLNYGYYRPQYYSQENYAKWDAKYELSKYNITYKSGAPKLWIVFEEGSVCGGLSKTAANLYGVWGTPAKVLGQPGHAAYAYLYNAGGGNNAWQLSYSVASTAWAATDGGGRMPNSWGNGWSSGAASRGSYHFLSQQAQNEYDKYEKAELILLQADTFKNDKEKLEQIYRDALAEEIINFDAWVGVISIYNADESKTQEDRIALAEEIAEVMAYHPLPMYDLTKLVATKITSPEYLGKMMMLQEKTLRKATKATTADTLYHKEVPVVANAILGVIDSRIATFSFSGANAGKIVLSKQFQSAQVTWSYSLDGGNNWKEVYEHSIQLTNEEIASINANDDIKIRISGLPLTDENIFTININKGVFPSNTVSIDDLENCINGTTDQMEWTLDPNSGEWTSFADGKPNLRGDVVVYLRLIASGTNTTSDPVHYTFTTNTSSESHRYISRTGLKVTAVSATSAGNKDNILDGDINTSWHGATSSGLGGAYKPSYVVIELDKPRYVAEVDYVPDARATGTGGYPTGKASKLEIYVSMDGTNWELAAVGNNLGNNNNLKKITFEEAKQAKYVKIHCPSVYQSGLQHYFSIAVINLYENPSASEIPTAEISYNITNKTNKDVIAELVDENRPITVTNNDGSKKHTFTENGEFTFEFVDDNGNKGTSTASVDWIDKTPPQADVTYSTTEITNEDVVATLSFDKENITILSKDVQIAENPVDGSKTITFENNASYELEFADELGNVGTKTIAVDWIDKEAPTAELTYSTMNLTDKPVTVTMNPSEEVTVLNNNGEMSYTFEENGTFTFEFVDRAGNIGTANAQVNWISKMPEYKLTYSTTDPTNQDVTVTLELEEGYRIVSDNGANTYTFVENGDYSFEYVDESGNRGVITASVNWIYKEAPIGTIVYSTETETTDPVTATITFDKENVRITNNNGNNTYIFEKNGEFTFEFVDAVGNTGTAKAIVDWIIDEEEEYTKLKEKCIAIIEEYMNNVTEEELNNKLINTEEKAKVIDAYNKLRESDRASYNEFISRLQAGGLPIITVIGEQLGYEEGTEIDLYSLITVKDNEDGDIIPSKDTVMVTTDLDINKAGIYDVTYEVTDSDGNKNSITIEITIKEKEEVPVKDPSFEVILESSKSVLNTGEEFEVTAKINNMRNIENGLMVIIGQFEYSTEELEIIGITGENGWNIDKDSFNKNNFKFVTDNGEFIKDNSNIFKIRLKVKENINEVTKISFKLKSILGSDGNADIETNDVELQLPIEEKLNISSDKYVIEENIISRILPETTFAEFKNNITINREISIIDKDGNVLQDDGIIKNDMILKIGDNLEMSLIVIGDVNKDGRITVTDLAQLKFHYIEKVLLEGNNLKAGDINGDGKVSLTDVAQLKLILVDLIELK